MRTINAYLSVALATLSLSLTSCLGSGTNEVTLAQQACVIEYEPTTFQKVAQLQGGTLITSTFIDSQSSLNAGDCGITDINVNFDDQPQGAKALKATTTNWVSVDKKRLKETGSTAIQGYDKLISDAVAYQYIESETAGDILFIITRHEELQDVKNEYELIFDETAKMDTVGGLMVYNMYLRCKTQPAEDGIKVIKGSAAAFDISSFMQTKGKELQNQGYEAIGVRLLYINKEEKLEDGTVVYKYIDASSVQPAKIYLPKKEEQ